MPSKSSASSATRKKHARKAQNTESTTDQKNPGTRSDGLAVHAKTKKDKKAPKIKQYTPPPTYVAAPDPVDTLRLGLPGSSVQAERTVILRKVGKKDPVTVERGLEEWLAWIGQVQEQIQSKNQASDEQNICLIQEVSATAPVLQHHFPRIIVHPSRRIRALTLNLFEQLIVWDSLHSPESPSVLLSPEAIEKPEYVGGWMVSLHDSDRGVRSIAARTWELLVELDPDATVKEGKLKIQDFADEALQHLVSLIELDTETDCHDSPSHNLPRKLAVLGESVESTCSRLRASALDALTHLLSVHPRPETLFPTIAGSKLGAQYTWKLILPSESEEPTVRKSMWNLIQELLTHEKYKPLIETLIPTLSTLPLHAAFAENDHAVQGAMVTGLVHLLNQYPSLWLRDDGPESAADGLVPSTSSAATNQAPMKKTSAMDQFYTYLDHACSSNPVSLYPALILLMASFPKSLEHSQKFFHHFWSAYGSRTLRSARRQGLSSFFRAWAECVLSIHRGLGPTVESLLQAQINKSWTELTNATFEFQDSVEDLARALCHVVHECDSLTDFGWSLILKTIELEMNAVKITRCLQFFNVVTVSHQDDHSWRMKAQQACELLFAKAIRFLPNHLESDDQLLWIRVVVGLLQKSFEGIEVVSEMSRKVLSSFCRDFLPQAVWKGSRAHYELFGAVLDYLPENAPEIWLAMMHSDHRRITPNNREVVADMFLSATNDRSTSSLPNPNLDKFVLDSIDQLSGGDTALYIVIEPIILCPYLFVGSKACFEIYTAIATALGACAKRLLFSLPQLAHEELKVILQMNLALQKSGELISGRNPDTAIPILNQIAIDAFMISSLLVSIQGDVFSDLAIIAKDLYLQVSELLATCSSSDICRTILRLLANCIIDTSCRVYPFELCELARKLTLERNETMLKEFLFMLPIDMSHSPTLLSRPSDRSSPPLLSIVDPLMRTCVLHEQTSSLNLNVKYNRIVLALIDILAQDRMLLQTQCWLWEHCLYLGQLASHIISTTVALAESEDLLSTDQLQAIVGVVDKNTTYLFSHYAPDITSHWHADIISKLLDSPKHSENETDPIKRLLLKLVLATQQEPIMELASSSLRKILSGLFEYSDSQVADFERWLEFCRKFERSNLNLTLSIIYSVKPYLLSSARFHQYQNHLAGRLTDTPVPDINTDGLTLVELLCATAPPNDSTHVFLPQPRVIFLLQAIGKWLKSEEDIETPLNNQLMRLFLYLAPIVQNITGSHWEQILDMISINLEDAAWEDEDSLIPLWHSCVLLKSIQELLKRNQSLQDHTQNQVQSCAELVLSLFFSAPLQTPMTHITEVVVEACESVLKESFPDEFHAEVSIDAVIKSVSSPSIHSAILGFTFAQSVIRQLVNRLAIEIELSPDNTTDKLLPPTLLDKLDSKTYPRPVGILMTWLTLFTYFEHASSRLKKLYSMQLRDKNLISEGLLPLVFNILGVSDRGKSADLSIWDIPFFDYTNMVEATTRPTSLAAHVYTLALLFVPSQVRSWWEDCRNKQLSLSVAAYTSRHFSPILVSRELDRLREPSVLSALVDENMSLKVSQAVREVKVTYVVDEESMEIIIRIPSDYPLQPVEVLDIRKVGVPEATWRAWLLVVQQTIVKHNGTIAEALSLFKKNISLHFEGVEACAICYAIISVVDRSLPNKACRTCHNRFHPSCLYKWFSTSHGSSCPLCRSLF